jgi:hypothetical protein
MASNTNQFAVRAVNISGGMTHHFATFAEACAHVKEHGFESVIERNGERLASWTVFGGWRYF